MTYDEASFPQDMATGLQDTIDFNDAGGFAWLQHHPNASGHVIEGFDFTMDWTTNLLTISKGVANLTESTTWTNDHSNEGGDSQKELVNATFRVQRGPSGDLNLTDGATNYIYLGLNQSENNTVFFQHNTTQTAPSEPYLRLGTVDTAAETVVMENRQPTITAKSMLITEDG